MFTENLCNLLFLCLFRGECGAKITDHSNEREINPFRTGEYCYHGYN